MSVLRLNKFIENLQDIILDFLVLINFEKKTSVSHFSI